MARPASTVALAPALAAVPPAATPALAADPPAPTAAPGAAWPAPTTVPELMRNIVLCTRLIQRRSPV